MIRLITIILLLLPLSSYSLPKDKSKHLIISGIISTSTSIVVYEFTENKKVSIISGVSTSLLIGLGKELIYDKVMRKGNPEFEDMLSNFVGVSFSIPLTLIYLK